MQAGQDITMTGATLAALGENGSMILSAGHNLTMDTDSLEAKKDMTENSDNYIRTYRKSRDDKHTRGQENHHPRGG